MENVNAVLIEDGMNQSDRLRKHIKDNKTALFIAGMIIGSSELHVRGGMIFWAYDLGMKGEALILIEKVLSLINFEPADERERERAEGDRQKIKEIMEVLGISIEGIRSSNDSTKTDNKISYVTPKKAEEIILPWWAGDVVGHMVGGAPRGFRRCY